MKDRGTRSIVAFLALAVVISFCGCGRNGNRQTNTEPPAQSSNQPAAGQAAAPATSPQPTPQQPAAAPQPQAPTQQGPSTPPPPVALVIPAGTRLRVRLDEDLGSKISQPGQTFTATVADDIVVNGKTVIPRRANAEGTVVDAKPLGRFKGGARLELRLERIHTRWGTYPVATSSVERVQQGKGRRTAKFAGGGGALGALIGGIAGGGKGALIGGLMGAGAGTAGTAMTGNQQILLPAETLVTFRLEHPVHVMEQ